ncbi:MAG TPA: hypothetical protein VMN03_03260 [Burkholderiales bacterium]|nr:hypothetical protein [Burkholderiales bacterium]
MTGTMTRCLRGIAAAALLAASGQACAESFVLSPELWDRPRSGRAVLEQPAVRQAVDACLQRPASRLVVHHGPAQSSRLAAEELRSWLAALAIEPGRISLRGGLQPSEPLRLEIE